MEIKIMFSFSEKNGITEIQIVQLEQKISNL